VREVPATLRWTNALGTGLAGAYGNWEVLVGSSWQTAPVPPAWGDTLLFDGAVSNAHCVGVCTGSVWTTTSRITRRLSW